MRVAITRKIDGRLDQLFTITPLESGVSDSLTLSSRDLNEICALTKKLPCLDA